MKIKFNITIDLGDSMIDFNDEDEREWFYGSVMDVNNIIVCSKELGDWIGDTLKIENIKELKDEKK